MDVQLHAHLRGLGLTGRTAAQVGVMEGIGAVRRLVCDHQGHRALVFHPRAKHAIREFSRYHRRKLPSGEYDAEPADNTGRSNPDNACDCVRYYAAFTYLGSGGRIEARRVGGAR